MSYLQMPAGIPEFNQAVISLWFRVPQSSMTAAADEFENAWNSDPSSEFKYGSGWSGGGGSSQTYSSQPPLMAGIIPLLIFGKEGSEGSLKSGSVKFGNWRVTYYQWHYTTFPDGVWVEDTSRATTNQVVDPVDSPDEEWSTEPSYIGVWCTGDPKRALLAVNLETAKHAAIQGGIQRLTGHTIMDRQFYSGPTDKMPARYWGQTFTFGEAGLYWPRTESFRTHPLVSDLRQNDGASDTSPPFGITVTPDEWHHLLLSFDLSIPCITHGPDFQDSPDSYPPTPSVTTDSAPKLWIAYDDVNMEGRDLSYYWPGKGAVGNPNRIPPTSDQPDDSNTDPNTILSCNGWRLASVPSGENQNISRPPDPATNNNEGYTQTSKGVVPTQYSLADTSLPTDGAPIGMPGSGGWVDHIHHVEMAELQMWTGIALSTADEMNRRAFIDFEPDADGAPSTVMIPVDPATAERLLGRKPDVMLHGSGDWIEGSNTGSTGVDDENKPVPDGQFQPVGGIVSYQPDPNLGGEQGDPQ